MAIMVLVDNRNFDLFAIRIVTNDFMFMRLILMLYGAFIKELFSLSNEAVHSLLTSVRLNIIMRLTITLSIVQDSWNFLDIELFVQFLFLISIYHTKSYL